MFDLRKLIFGAGGNKALPAHLRGPLEAWLALPEPPLDALHFHTRYVVVDVAATGNRPDQDKLLSIAAVGLTQAGVVHPGDALTLSLDGPEDDPAVDIRLAAFLQFIGKAPMIAFHAPFAAGFIRHVVKARLGIDFAPRCIDLAWLLPAMFSEKARDPQSLDQWLSLFEVEPSGRRDVMENTLQLARLTQRLLSRAGALGIDTAERLLEESEASSFLRQNH